jgi:hypothetical protein
MKKIIIITIIGMMSCVMLVGCKSREATIKTPVSSSKLMAPNIVGKVLDVNGDNKAVLVDSTTDNVKGQIWVIINDKTNFFENINKGISIPYHDVSHKFIIGNYVELYINGAILESYPMKGTASAVYVNEGKK